jgi:hypothetical protein
MLVAEGVERPKMTDVPNTHERKALQNGCYGGPAGENEAQLYVGKKIRDQVIEKGWLERMPDSLNGTRMYRTTEAGQKALQATPQAKPARPKLTMLKPRIAAFHTQRLKPIK